MQPRKQHLVDTALTLFNLHGYHATGIDLILKESQVSKATLYKHFRSKDELILAALQQRHEQVLLTVKANVEKANNAGESAISAIFDGLNEWFNSDTFLGCNFINVSAEYADKNHPLKRFAAVHKQSIVELIKTQCHLDKAYAETQANQIDLLIEGAIVMAHTRGIKNAALMAKGMAESLISNRK